MTRTRAIERNRGKASEPAPTVAGKVTLRTVAAHLGLSVTTVSRALKDGPEVNLATREKVASAASTLGYRPHLAGINLRTGRTHAVGIFLPLERAGEINNVASSLVEGASAYLSRVGYRTTVVPILKATDSLNAVRELVHGKAVDGIILKNTVPQDARVKFLLEVGFPFVTFGRTELFTPHPHLDIDHEAIGTQAAHLLFEAGHLAPILVAPPQHYTYTHQFLRGWRAAHAERLRPCLPSSILFAATTPNHGRDTAGHLLSTDPHATGAFVASEETALGFVAGLHQAGRRVGEDFGVVTYGGSQLHSFITPPLSTFSYSQFEVGEKLARSLMAMIGGAQPTDLHEIVHAELDDHQSHVTRRP